MGLVFDFLLMQILLIKEQLRKQLGGEIRDRL